MIPKPFLAFLAVPFAAQAAVFDQGPVEPRDFRNPVLARIALSEGVETESLFGFTLGSDVDGAGSRGVAIETIIGQGRRDGRYSAVNSKLELSYGASDTISVSLGLLGGWRDIRGVTGMTDTNTVRFDGVGTELRWRFLDRKTSPVGLTLHIEPTYRIHDEATGEPGRGIGAENKLILDGEIIPGRLFGALNLIYDIETFRPRGGTMERASTGGIGAAFSYQIAKGVFLGAETRYLRAYDGVLFNRYAGDAIFAGPSVFWRPTPALWISAAASFQLSGYEINNQAAYNLANFNRVQARLKIGMEF